MGTRADFSVGRGEHAEWLGSIAWDGYPDGIPIDIVRPDNAASMDEAEYRGAVTRFLAEREDATLPEHGWPWPWDNSQTTDYAYAWDEHKVWASCFGGRWYRANDPQLTEDDIVSKEAVFPDMTSRKKVTLGKRSGVLVIGPTGGRQ
jgi:hypothetical protein